VIFGDGIRHAPVMVVDGAARLIDERAGRPLAGEAGAVFSRVSQHLNFSSGDFYFTNLVKKGSQPGLCCHFLEREIEVIKPKFILLFGEAVARELCGWKYLQQPYGILKWVDGQVVTTHIGGKEWDRVKGPIVLVTYRPTSLTVPHIEDTLRYVRDMMYYERAGWPWRLIEPHSRSSEIIAKRAAHCGF
jgi:uracil-DNA glycosylase family 4